MIEVCKQPMMRLLYGLLMLCLTACASSTPLQAVTPLPANYAASATPDTAAPSPQVDSTVPPARPGAQPTPTPLSTNLPFGSARELAFATDSAMHPTIETRLVFEESPVSIRFDEFYDGFDMRRGLLLSQRLLSLDGEMVTMEGYMAPPLKPELDYFVLTRIRLQVCPFCSSAGDWPDDIALVYLPAGETTVATERPIRLSGRLEVGIAVDAETGMVSLVRIYAETLEVIA
jgi:hypothetical protein